MKLIFAKILCHTASLVYLNFVCFVDSLSLFLRKTTIKKSCPVRRRKASAHLKVSLIAYSTIELLLGRPHRVKLSKLNQISSTWTEFLRQEKCFFFQFFISSIFIRFDFIHCEPTG